MSYTVQFSPVARDQLAELEDYISEAGNPAAAKRYVDAIVAFCESLAMFPLRGNKRDDLLPGLRITNYRRRTVVAFLVNTESRIVSIVGVHYGGQSHEARFLSDIED